MLPAAISCSFGFHTWVRLRSISVIVELALAAVFVAKAGRKLQSAGSASDDHDPGFS